MQQIENLGENIELKVSDEILHKWNEAELFPVIINYKENIKGIIKSKQKDFLLRNCIIWDKSEHNKEIQNIYDTLISINEKYKEEKKDFKLNIINHLTDSDWNIYIKNILTKKTFNVYDLMPDSFYIDPEKKDSSKFNEFKESVNELKLNKIYIITKLFEQLAILHANNFVVWNIKIWDKLITHPTLSLFLYRLKNKKWNINEEIFIHDIHNLKLLENPKSNDYINHCISDLKDLAFDIIRFFKWIWLPQWWFITYAKVLRQLNPELYSIVYRSFLWDPKIEIEIWALEKSMSENKKHQKTSSKVLSELETFKNDKIEVINSLFRKNDLFFLAK